MKLGETCSHVAAMLFKIEAAVRIGYTTSSCTSEACKWNSAFLKNVTAAPISDIRFYKDNHGSKSSKKHKTINTPSEQEIGDFLKELNNHCRKSVLLSAYVPYHEQFIDKTPTTQVNAYPVDIRSLYTDNPPQDNMDNLYDNVIKKVFDVNESQCKNLCKITVAQSGCPVWFCYRVGRITAHNLLRTSLDTPSKSAVLAITTLGSKTFLGPAVQHGNKFEQKAIDTCVSEMKRTHNNVTVCKTGLTLSADTPYIAASPDFILTCDCCGEWVGEVKCPFSYKDELIDSINDNKFCVQNGTLKNDHPYYTQCQVHMYCTGIKQCLFVVWTFKDCKILNVELDQDFLSTAIANLSDKYKKVIVPEILCRQLEQDYNKVQQAKVDKENSKKVFCICNGPETPTMIGCDNPKCKTGNQWFHFACIKMKRAPKGKWFCATCKKSAQ